MATAKGRALLQEQRLLFCLGTGVTAPPSVAVLLCPRCPQRRGVHLTYGVTPPRRHGATGPARLYSDRNRDGVSL